MREAIQAANTNLAVDKCAAGSATERDAIHFSLGKKATITLDSQLPNITDPSGLSINGQKAKITVSGNDSVRVFVVGSGAKLTLANLKVADGFAASPAPDGGGLLNSTGGTVKVTNSTFSGNTVDGIAGGQGATGGAIANDGTLMVTNSTFSYNSSTGQGGGISSSTLFGVLTITNSTFSENSASAGATIEAFGATTLRSTIVANPTQGSNCSGTITDGGYNVDDGTSCNFSLANYSLPSTPPARPQRLAAKRRPHQDHKAAKRQPRLKRHPRGH